MMAFWLERLVGLGEGTRILFLVKNVPGHSCWPQNQPFDRNLALLISRITSLLGKSTTHKMPQSADLFGFRQMVRKRPILLKYLVTT